MTKPPKTTELSHQEPRVVPVALVTGGGTGVGKACVEMLAEMGYNVIVNYSRSKHDAESLAESATARTGNRCLAVACDVSNEQQVVAMLRQIEDQFGRLDVVVNNAATTQFIEASDLEAMTEEKWDRILAVNTKGPFFVTKAAASLLKRSGIGSVVNVSSVAGTTGQGSCIAYAASKAALNTMTKSLARALAPEIRVNAVLPGPIDSRWIRQGDNNWDLEEMTRNYPIPRASSPREIAEGIVFLATGTAMTTGQLLTIDGGQTLV